MSFTSAYLVSSLFDPPDPTRTTATDSTLSSPTSTKHICPKLHSLESEIRMHEVRYDSTFPAASVSSAEYSRIQRLLSQCHQHFAELPSENRVGALADELCHDAKIVQKRFNGDGSLDGYHQIWIGYMNELFMHERKDCAVFVNYTTHKWNPSFWGWSEDDVQSAGKLVSLQASADWWRFKEVIRWTPFGAPRKFYHASFHGSLSDKSLASTWYVMVLEESTGIPLEKVEVVLDFGGGSSSQAQAMRRLGFQGTYFIYDLPPVSLLQRFFLRVAGYSAVWFDDYISKSLASATSVTGDISGLNVLVSKVKVLRSLLPSKGVRLFFATYSLSETPISKREEIRPVVHQFDIFFIWFADRPGLKWDPDDDEEQQTSRWGSNLRYFQRFLKDLGDISYCLWRGGPETSSGSYALVATRQELGRVVCAKIVGCGPDTILKCGAYTTA